MAIRYRRAGDGGRPHREGTVDTVAELEALVSIGTLHGTDEVALDGVRFQRAKQIPALRDAFSEAPDGGSLLGDALLLAGVAVVALAAVGFVFKIAAVAVKLAVFAGIALGAVWVIRKIRRPKA